MSAAPDPEAPSALQRAPLASYVLRVVGRPATLRYELHDLRSGDRHRVRTAEALADFLRLQGERDAAGYAVAIGTRPGGITMAGLFACSWPRRIMRSVTTVTVGAAVFVAASVGAVGVWAQPASPGAMAALPAELFFKEPEVFDAQLSPNGKRLAVSTSIGGRVGLFVWDLDGEIKALPTARFADIDIADFTWVNDERLVFGVMDLSEGGARQLSPGLFSVRPDGSELRELIGRNVSGRSGATQFGRPLPRNHRLLSVPAGAGDEVIVGEITGTVDELVQVRPLRLNVANGRSFSLGLEGPRNTLGWLFDAQGNPRLAISGGAGRRQLHWRSPGDGDWKLIDDRDSLADGFQPAFVDERGGLFVTHSEGAARTHVLTRFDFTSGKPAEAPVVRVPGFDFRGRPVYGDAGKLIGIRVNADAETTVWFDESMARVQKLADERLPGYVNRLSCRRCGQADMVVLVRAWSDRDPGHLWLYQAGTAAGASPWRFVTRVRPGVDPRRMASVAFERIRARDGRDLPVWLTVPPGRQADKTGAAVVLVHGGPWVRGGAWRWDGMAQFLASRGYVVIEPEFRGSAGYGAEHVEAGFKQWGQAMQDDVADAGRWAMAQGWADRLCIAGGSYGGYSTLMGLVRDGDLYRCGVAWAAVSDPYLYIEGSWWIDDNISYEGRRHRLPRMVGDPDKDRAMLDAASPLLQAARIRRPLLLAHGQADRRVPIQHSERLRKALREAGNDPAWVSYPDEGHGWFKLETRLDFARRMEQFLAEHLKPVAR